MVQRNSTNRSVSGERLSDLARNGVALFITQSMSSHTGSPYANVVTIAGEVVARWRDQAELRGLKLSLKVECYDLVRVDSVKLASLLDKLVGNAIRFTPAGSITVTIARPNGWSAPGSLVVSDTGIGMSPRQLTTLFEASAAGKLERMGPGQPMVQSLATSMGCSIDVKSELGKGTQFEVVFPR